MSEAPSRPALRYYGGKWSLANWIISYFPPHTSYVEPCGGAANVLLVKPRSDLETYNDLEKNVVNFFQVLRDKPEQLITKISLTPWARYEYEISMSRSNDPVEAARRFWVLNNMSIGMINQSNPGFKVSRKPSGNPAGSLMKDDIYTELMKVAKRFIGVQIECKDALELIENHNDTSTLIYFDPPYLKSERTKKDGYILDQGDDFHFAAAEILHRHKGYVAISGYAHQIYVRLYERHGWVRRDKESITNSGGKRIESLWLSPRTWNALQAGAGLPLFATTEASR